MGVSTTTFYQTGGTLRSDAPSYVERQADSDLYDGLLQGEFCYVLHSRQMGKSSLMVRTASRLRKEGVAVVVLDLTALGRNLTAEQWYDGLLRHLGWQLELEDELEEFWLAHPRWSPLQRWMAALREVLLPRCPGRVVIFVDEIDAVRSLPFDTDEFFAAIRECYNRRTQDPEFGRLTFCLLGVASPSDLIQDTRTTPFNIGRRIELTDFTEAEASPLAEGWERAGKLGAALLGRVLYWTGGHPYLTQRLCQAAAGDAQVTGPESVDRLCADLFLSPRAREQDDNLLFVRERMLRSEADLVGLLDLYTQVQQGKRVPVDETNALVSLLRLSGIVRPVASELRVRNRIYERVFDRAWVRTHMPDAEVRRQRAAYRRGLVRATTIAAVVVAVTAGLALTAMREARRADRVAREEARQRRLAQGGQRQLRHHLYAARVSQAQHAEQLGNVARALQLLDALRPETGQEDLRGFEWRYLWRQCQDTSRATLRGHTGGVFAVAVSPDAKTVASAGEWDVRLWDALSGRQTALLRGSGPMFWDVALSPDGKLLAASSADGTVRLWEIASRHLLATLRGHHGEVGPLAFSSDGRLLASGSRDKTVRLWDVASRREVDWVPGFTGWLHSLAFAADRRTLAIGQEDGRITLWDVASRRIASDLKGHTAAVQAVVFSPDGKLLASGSGDGTIRLWAGRADRDARGAVLRQIAVLRGHTAAVRSVHFSHDGQFLASGGDDHTIRLWNVAAQQEVGILRGHSNVVYAVAFSPDGQHLASAGGGTIKLWDVPASRAAPTVVRPGTLINALAFSPDGRVLAMAGQDGSVKLGDVRSGRTIATFSGHNAAVVSLEFSRDGQRLASAGDDQMVKLWDVASRSLLASFPGFRGRLGRARLAPDGRTLAMSGRDDTVKLIDLSTKRTSAVFPAVQAQSWGIAFSPDGKLLAAVSRYGTVTLWDTATTRAAATLSGHDVVGFSPDGKILAVRDYNGIPKLWDLASKRVMASLNGHTLGNGGLAFSPDNRTLATGGTNAKDVLLWSLTTQDEAAMLTGHAGAVVTVAFSPDSNILASSSTDGTVRLWRAASFQQTDPLGVIAGGGNRTVLLRWRLVPGAVGYRIYRRLASKTDGQWVPLTPRPIQSAAFLDRSPGLADGSPQTYAVASIFPGTAGKAVERARVTCRGTPVAAPPGFAGYSIDEGSGSGSAAFDAALGLLHLLGSGGDIWGRADQFYALSQPVAGDFQITVRALGRPTYTDQWAKAGLMVREGLEPGARNVFLAATAGKGLVLQGRLTAKEESDIQGVLPGPKVEMPLTLRLTRQGDTITGEYSRDGRHFQPAGEPWTFAPPLPQALDVGVAITAHNVQKITEATFRDLQIRPR